MIESEFSIVTFDDIPLLTEYLRKANYQESNHNIINMFMWQTMFPLFKYVTDDYVLLLGKHGDLLFLYMPLCEPQTIKHALLDGQRLFKQAKIPFVLSTFTRKMKSIALEIFPMMHACTARDGYDYVYDREKIVTLSGKKHQKRRNLLNRFVREYQGRAQLVPIQSFLKETIEFFEHSYENSDNDYLIHERTGILHVLTHLELFDTQGAALLIDQEVKGFLVTSFLTQDMVQINIEKADKTIPGIFQYMESEYFKLFYPDVKYINKEDDMGHLNLRKAKMASKPVKLIAKYRLCEEGHDACKGQCSE